MSLLNVPAGKDLPEDIYVVIEIPANADPIKYEVDKESGALFVDRFMSTAMFYPCNYGYINHTLSLDGDPVDVLVPTPYPLEPGSVIRCRPVGVLKMTDESGEDAKLVAVPHTKLSKEYDHIKDVNDLPELLKAQITHFFEHYKDLEAGKWVKVDGWDNAECESSRKKQRHPKVALSLLILVFIQPVAAFYQREALNGALIDIHPGATVGRLDQVTSILAAFGTQRIQFSQRRCVNTIDLTMYRAIAGHRAWIVAQAVQLIIIDTMIAQPLSVGHPVAVALFAS